MALQSMTGFARAEASSATDRWVWELRCVNGRGLDVRLRLPPGTESLEQAVRKAAARHIARGSLQIALQLERLGAGSVPTVNEEALDAVLAASERLRDRLGSPPPAAEQILAIKGVMELKEADEAPGQAAERERALLASLEEALAELKRTRGEEGSAIAQVLADQLTDMQGLTDKVRDDPSRTMEAIRERLAEHVASLRDGAAGLDLDRVHQEAAILAAKADLREELDRLDAHIAQARTLIDGDGPAGRKLEFLAQEFNRECNTICSKSNAVSVTTAGLEMKVIIDQFREQVQNLE